MSLPDPYDLEHAASGEIADFEHETGVEREAIPRALAMSRDDWVDAMQGRYWSDIPEPERRRLAGGLWDRIHRLAKRRREVRP